MHLCVHACVVFSSSQLSLRCPVRGIPSRQTAPSSDKTSSTCAQSAGAAMTWPCPIPERPGSRPPSSITAIAPERPRAAKRCISSFKTSASLTTNPNTAWEPLVEMSREGRASKSQSACQVSSSLKLVFLLSPPESGNLKKMLSGLCWDDGYTIVQCLGHRWLQAKVPDSRPGDNSHFFFRLFSFVSLPQTTELKSKFLYKCKF